MPSTEPVPKSLNSALISMETSSTPVPADQTQSVTFDKDVLPILQNNCQTCHRPGGIAPSEQIASLRDCQRAKGVGRRRTLCMDLCELHNPFRIFLEPTTPIGQLPSLSVRVGVSPVTPGSFQRYCSKPYATVTGSCGI